MAGGCFPHGEKKLLLLDISNTFTKWMFLDGTDAPLPQPQKTPTASLDAAKIKRLFSGAGRAVICSVVPPVGKAVKRLLPQARFISYSSPSPLTFSLENPARLGADRIANAIGAVSLYGAPVVAIDMGTATTFEVVDSRLRFIGGIIAPGLGSMAASLHEKTAQLPMIDLAAPSSVLGRNTKDAMQSGVVLGYAGLVQHLLDAIKKELPASRRKITLVATGGDAPIVLPLLEGTVIHNPLLTFEGMRVVAGEIWSQHTNSSRLKKSISY